MKILFYSNSSTLYGAPSSLLNLINGIKNIDRNVSAMVIIPSTGDLAGELHKNKIPYKKITYIKWIHSYHTFLRKRSKFFLLAYAWRLKNLVHHSLINIWMLPAHISFCKKYHPDIIYINSSIAPMGALVGYFTKTKVVWHHRETLNDPIVGFSLDCPKWLVMWLMSITKLHIFPSKYLKSTYQWLRAGRKEHVQFNGVFFKDFKIPKALKSGKEVITFGVIGRINKQKGLENVLKVFSAINTGVELLVYGKGDPSYVRELQSMFKSPNIHFEGFVKKSQAYGRIDYLITNAQNESFGRVIAEANAYGIPAIGKSSGATVEVVKNGVNGYQYQNVDDLRNIIDLVKSKGAIGYDSLCKSSRKYFEDNFSIEHYSEGILSQLKKVK